MRTLLIRYLLGELDPQQHEQLERRLADSAELRRELAHLRTCFAAACQADEADDEPPRGLAERTTERIACGAEGPDDFNTQRAAALAADDPPAGAMGWSLADLTVAGGVVLAVSMLLFPALGDSRNATRRNVCQNNQRQLGMVLFVHAQDHGRYFPRIAPEENAGMFAIRLTERGYITPDELTTLLVCPGAPLADAVRAGQFAVWIPSSGELRAMSPRELAAARKKMSPFYAYRFPYRVGDQYQDIRDDRLPLSPLLSDAPGPAHDGLMSSHHGGSVIQVFFQDGSLKSLTTTSLPGRDDELFLNNLGLVAAGCDRDDAVLGRSDATPAFHWPIRRR